MERNNQGRGRSRRTPLPPRIDVTPEELAHVVLNAGRPIGPVSGREYFCVECDRQVAYPETLYQDGKCEQCHNKPSAEPVRRCTCGIEVAKAKSRCTEGDCPFK